jgi:phage tail sheath gpL-like
MSDSNSTTDNSSAAIGQIQPEVISFDEIPVNIEVPGTYVEIKPNYSQAGLIGYAAKVIIIGQMLSSGIATPNSPYPLYTKQQAQNLFGVGSVAAQMAEFFLQANPWVAVDIMGVADASSTTKAAQTVTITGTATQADTLRFYAQGTYVPVGVNVGDTAAVIAGNLATALQATDGLDTVATVASNVVTQTALHGGTLGNALNSRLNYRPGDATPPGVTVAITAMTGGATDPTINSALSAISAAKYTDLVMPWVDANNVSALENWLAARYVAMVRKDCHAYGVLGMSYGSGISNQSTLNSKNRSVLLVQNPPQPPWVWAASFAGVASFYLAQDPSRQLRGLALPGIMAPAPADVFDDTERNLLLGDGISTFDVQVDGTVTLEKVVNEYLTTDGVLDLSWHDIMATKVGSRIAYDWKAYQDLLYPRNKLADDGSLAAEYDPTVATPNKVKASWGARSVLYEKLGWIENSAQTAQQSAFVRDKLNGNINRLNCRLQYQRIGNLMVEAVSLEFLA